MEMQMIGPLGKVTGSCTWLRDTEKRWSFLVDCGMQQGEKSAANWNSGAEWPFDLNDIQFVALTHAHIDHCGLIPELYRRGFAGPVYCTPTTRKLSQALLFDAARLAGTPFSESDVDRIKWRDDRIDRLGGYHPVETDLFLRFFRSGHIVGATSICVIWGTPGTEQRSIVFSGDVGPGSEDHETLPFLRFPMHPKPANYAVIESTYGNVVRPPEEYNPEKRRARLIELLDRTVKSDGTLAVAAFSVGRTQDIMFDLHHIVAASPGKYDAVEFLLDSPLAAKVNAITLEALNESSITPSTGKVRPNWLGKQLFRDLGLSPYEKQDMKDARRICEMTLRLQGENHGRNIHSGNQIARDWHPIFGECSNREARLNAQDNRPRVVLFSSGSCDGGPAAAWLPRLLRSNQNTVVLTGFAPATSVAAQLLALEHVPIDQRQLLAGAVQWLTTQGDTTHAIDICDIEAAITSIHGYSAHADQRDLVNWVFQTHRGKTRQAMGQTIFINHGVAHASTALKQALQNRACEWSLPVEVSTPSQGQGWISLDTATTGDGTTAYPCRAEISS